MGEETTKPPFQLHLEPDTPFHVEELTGALNAIARQFEVYALEEGIITRGKDAKLLVTSVTPGSIDVGLLPDIGSLGTLLAPFLPLQHAVGFAEKLKRLFDAFKKKDEAAGVTVKDCDDAGAIVTGTANHGGTQTFNVIQGGIYAPMLVISSEDARQIAENAALRKAELQFPHADTRQRVAMVWAGMDTDKPRAKGSRNPDKGIIEEIDPKGRPIFFEDEFTYLKREMLDGEENPYRKIYFVDVSISRVDGRVASYKIIGFHGTDDREEAA